ncbi:MAG: hypothetical protein AAGJ83_06515, partial [Planctomycetota bacterium]
GQIPLIVTRPYGYGKVLFMGTDAAWRWRLGVEDRYHYRFWGQVIRWMAYQRTLASGKRMRLSYLPESVMVGDEVTLRASVMSENGNPFQAAFLNADLIGPRGERRAIRLIKSNEDWGVFRGSIKPLRQAGNFQVVLSHPEQQDSELALTIPVRGRAGESAGRPAKPQFLRDLAAIGEGISVDASESPTELVNALNQRITTERRLKRFAWWHHPAVLFTLIGGLSLFWILRRRAGAI